MTFRPSSCDDVLVFAGVAFLFGGMTIPVGAPASEVLSWIAIAWVLGALWQLGRIDGERFRIDPWWLLLLIGGGVLWQVQTVGPDAARGLVRALTGAGLGFLVGAVPILGAKILGRRWPLCPGDALLFTGLGVLMGPLGVLWVVSLGVLASLARHFCVQRRRGRCWKRGSVALGPGMAAAAAVVFVALNFSLVVGAGT